MHCNGHEVGHDVPDDDRPCTPPFASELSALETGSLRSVRERRVDGRRPAQRGVLQISLTGAREKLAQLDQIATKTTITPLGMPSFPQIARRPIPPTDTPA